MRYLVVETGNWLNGREVLISPISIGQPNWTDKVLPVSITRNQMKDAPSYDSAARLNREQEASIYRHYERSRRSGGRSES